MTTRRRHHPQPAGGHSSSSVDIWKRHSQFNPDYKQAQQPVMSAKAMGRSQSTDSINDLAESLLMEVGSNQATEEDHQIHPSREYFAPIPQLSHQSGASLYSMANGTMLGHHQPCNGDTKSMVIMPNLQPNRYQMPQQHRSHPSPVVNHQQIEQSHQQHHQSHYHQFNSQQPSAPFYYQKQQGYQASCQTFTPAIGAQSLPYMSRSISVDSYSPASPSVKPNTNATNESSVPPFSKKIPRNCELEEYARRYEALQRQSSARRRSSREQKKKQLQQQQMESNGPKSLQHHLPLNGANSCPNPNNNNKMAQINTTNHNQIDHEADNLAKTHLRSTLLRKYSNDLWNIGTQTMNGEGLPNRESGRESVSTILSNSSSETVRYQDSLVTSNGGNPESLYHSLHNYREEQNENTVPNGMPQNRYSSAKGSKQPMSISEFAFNDTPNPMPPASLSWQQEKEKTLKCDNSNKTTTTTADIIDNTDGGSDAMYASLTFGNMDKQGLQNQQYASMSYLQSNNPAKDLKRFPLQTYANGQCQNEPSYDESGYSMLPLSNNAASNQTAFSNVTGAARTTLKQRKQKGSSMMPSHNDDLLPHSKSVPNLSTEKQTEGDENRDENTSPDENSFSYLDPEKRLRVSDNTLKLIQKQALRDYYERHNTLSKKSSQSNRKNNSTNEASVSSGLQNPAETSNASSTDLDSGFYSPTDNSKHQALDTSNNEVKSSNASSPSTDVKSAKMGSFDIRRNYSHRSASQSSTRSSLSSTSTATTVHRKSSVDTVINANAASMNTDAAIYCNGHVSSSFADTKTSFSKVGPFLKYLTHKLCIIRFRQNY